MESSTMPSSRKLLAWIDPQTGDRVTAAFVASAMASKRSPVTRRCASQDEARQWVEREAAALGDVPVEWIDRPPLPVD
jgi:hypothetical protein